MGLKITISSIALALIAIITHSEQGQILCASILGSALGGYMGSFYFQGKTRDGQLTFKKRWAANIATGSCAGPMLTTHFMNKAPEVPPIFLSLAISGAVGGMGVLLLTIILPPIISWLRNLILKSKDD